MKKILLYFLGLGLVLGACNPMDEIYDEIEATDYPTVKSLEITLADDDYDLAGGNVAKFKNFSSSNTAEEFMPIILDAKYPGLGKGSIAQVTYAYYRGGLEYLNFLTDAESYELTTDDYDSMGEDSGQPGRYNNFSSSTPPEDYLPAFFAAKYPDAAEDDLVFVTYKYYSGSVETRSEYYGFDGSVWAAVEVELPDGVMVYTLTGDDYDSMGEDSGKPGRYNNFSGSIPPEDYLPTFLSLKFPYAAEGDKIATVYRYYAGGGVTETRADEYSLSNGAWEAYSSVIQKSDQFIHTGADGWLFDPSVVFTMSSADFQLMVDYVNDTHGSQYLDSYGTAEFYYGAGSYYSNFDMRETKWNDSVFGSAEDAVKEGIAAALLPSKFPNAVAQVSGVDVMYVVTWAYYDGSNGERTFVYQCTKSGPSPEFVFVEER